MANRTRGLAYLLVVGSLLFSVGDLHATEEYEGDVLTELLGWSTDGKYWGVRVDDIDRDGSLIVLKGILRLDRDTCAPVCDTVWKVSGLEYAPAGGKKVQHLMPVSGAWRKLFAATYEITRKNTRLKHKDNPGSSARFCLHRRGERGIIWETSLSFGYPDDLGTVGFAGGYLHPNGKSALLKFHSTSTDVNSPDRDVYHTTRFKFVDLKAGKKTR